MKKIWKWSAALCLALLAGILMYAPTEVKAKALTTGKCGSSVTYSFDSTTGALTISGRGDMTDYGPNSPKSPFAGHEEIRSVKIGDGVTSVGTWLFYDCFGLQSAELGKDVKTVREWSFYGCVGLADLVMQPDSVNKIEDGAFMHCKELKTINLPESVTYLGCQVFDDTGYYQTRSNWKNNVLYIGHCLYSGVYNEVYTNPRHASTTKPYGGGSGGGSITSPDRVVSGNYTIKEGTTVIAANAFRYAGAKTVVIPESVNRISGGAFSGSGLESITIPNSIYEIGGYAFEGCTKLKEITIPKNVKTIGDYAFARCNGLKSVTLSNGLVSIGDNAFAGAPIKSITIPKTVKTLGNSVFYGCGSLKKVTLKSGLRAIGEEAFKRTAIKSITVPKSVTVIGRQALGYDVDGTVKGFKIRGYKGSTAQKYAKSNKIKFVAIKK